MPDGWMNTPLLALGELRLGKMLDKTRNQGVAVQYLRNVNVRWFEFDIADLKDIRVSDEERDLLTVQDGDLFICEGGEPGRCAVWRAGANSLVYQKALHRFRTNGAVVPEFLMYRLRHDVETNVLQSVFTGTTIKHLTRESLAKYLVPLPAIAEQTRIADQLDKLLARIQGCNDRVDAIPALLKRFRQAVLVVATSGRLTSDWREERCASDVEWPTVTVESIAETVFDGPFGSHLKSADYSDEGVRVVRLENIGALQFLADKQTFIPESKYATLQRHTLKKDDVLFSSFVDEEVRVCIYPADDANKAINKADVFCIRTDRQLCSPSFLALRLGCKTTYVALRKQVHGATRPRINLSQIRGFAIGLPSLEEQAEIVRRVKVLFNLADRIEARYTAARAQAQRLNSLLLAKAFRGELVLQDPQNVPARVLLERIAATPPAKVRPTRGRPRLQPERQLPLPELDPSEWASLPAGAWAAPADPEGHATMVWVTAVLRAWGRPVPEREARLTALLCQQPRLFTAVLPAAEAMQWSRLVGDEAKPLPTQVFSFQPAINSHWGRAIKGMRARDDLVEAGLGDGITWALGAGAANIETAGWPDGRARFVVAHLRAHGTASVLPLLESSAQEFVHASAA